MLCSQLCMGISPGQYTETGLLWYGNKGCLTLGCVAAGPWFGNPGGGLGAGMPGGAGAPDAGTGAAGAGSALVPVKCGGGGGGGGGDVGRGFHSFPFQLNSSSAVHRITQINS